MVANTDSNAIVNTFEKNCRRTTTIETGSAKKAPKSQELFALSILMT
jgi:hypothetical protein